MKKEVLRMNHISSIGTSSVEISDLSMNLYVGEVLGIMGNCSSGKTKLLHIITGEEEFTAGTLFLNEQLIQNKKSRRRCQIALIERNPKLIDNMSITDNLLVVKGCRKENLLIHAKAKQRIARQYLEEFGMNFVETQKVAELSEDQKCMLEIVKAYMEGAEIILIDDFANMFSNDKYLQFYHMFEYLKTKGISFIVTGSQAEPLQICSDRIQVIFEGTNRIVFKNQKRNQVDFGKLLNRNIHPISRGKQEVMRETMFEAKAIVADYLNEISFAGIAGEILAIVDFERETSQAVYHLLQHPRELRSGQMLLGHQPYSKKNIYRQAGFLDFDTPDKVVPLMSLGDNLCISSFARFTDKGLVKKQRIRFIEEEFAKWYPEYGKDEWGDCVGISEKDQIAILLFRLKLQKPKVIFCQEPRGIMAEVLGQKMMEVFRELTEQGSTIIIFSSNLESAQKIAERILIINGGIISEEYQAEELTNLQT